MMKAYAGSSNRGGGNSNRGGNRNGGNILQRAGRAIRNGVTNAVNRVRGR